MEPARSHRRGKGDESPADPPDKSDNQLAPALYARMHERGESLTEAANALGLTPAEVDAARTRLVQLGLLNAQTQVTAEPPAALAQRPQASHRVLDRLVEQQVEYLERDDSQALLNQRIDEFVELARHETPAAWACRRGQ